MTNVEALKKIIEALYPNVEIPSNVDTIEKCLECIPNGVADIVEKVSTIAPPISPDDDTEEWTRLNYEDEDYIKCELLDDLFDRASENNYYIGRRGYDVKIRIAPRNLYGEYADIGNWREFIFGPDYGNSEIDIQRILLNFPMEGSYKYSDNPGEDTPIPCHAMCQGIELYNEFVYRESGYVERETIDGVDYYVWGQKEFTVRAYMIINADGSINNAYGGFPFYDSTGRYPQYYEYYNLEIWYRKNAYYDEYHPSE